MNDFEYYVRKDDHHAELILASVANPNPETAIVGWAQKMNGTRVRPARSE